MVLSAKLELINPQRMRRRVTAVVLCVCVCVCVCVCLSVCLSVTKLAATYLVCESKVRRHKDPYGVRSKRMICVDFAENALFASFGVICHVC